MMAGNVQPRVPTISPPKQFNIPQTRYLPGRYINNENDIMPGEIPMDGSISFFCMGDLSRIIIKQWNSQGVIDTMSYSLDRPQQIQAQVQQQANPEPLLNDPPQQQPQQPDALQVVEKLSASIETAFNNLAQNLSSSLQAINNRLDDIDGGRG